MAEGTSDPRTSVHHIVYEVDSTKLVWEIEFWKALGFGRITRPEPKWKGEWLNGFGLHIRLLPIGYGAYDVEVNEHQRVAIIPRYGLDATLENLDRSPFRTYAEEREPYWGARHVIVRSPSGYHVELLEREPPAVWTGPPTDD